VYEQLFRAAASVRRPLLPLLQQQLQQQQQQQQEQQKSMQKMFLQL